MKTTFYIILLLITAVSSCSKEAMQNDTIEEPIFSNVIYLDFDGENMKDNAWNDGVEMYLQPSGLSGSNQREVIKKVKGYFQIFRVTVTDQKNIYLQANAGHRQHVILTTTSQWYLDGLQQGTAILNHYWEDIPCFVFTQNIYFNPEGIAIVAAHELGHTLGLYHQSLYDSNCTQLNKYRNGSIMGIVDLKGNDKWVIGQSQLGCDSIQDDVKQMASILSFK